MIEKRILKRISVEAKPGRRKYLRLETQGNVVQCLALSHLRVGTHLSNRIKTFPFVSSVLRFVSQSSDLRV